MQQRHEQRGKAHVLENNLYDSLSRLQKRLQDSAEANGIRLLKEDVPDWEDRLALIQSYIEVKYAESTDGTSS